VVYTSYPLKHLRLVTERTLQLFASERGSGFMRNPRALKRFSFFASVAAIALVVSVVGYKFFTSVGDVSVSQEEPSGSVSIGGDRQMESNPDAEVDPDFTHSFTPDSFDVEESIYSKSVPLKEVYSEVKALAEAGDAEASLFLVKAEQQCLIARANPITNGLMLNAIGETLADDEDGRKFFNQLIAYASAGISDFEELTEYVSESGSYCEGFDEPINHAEWFHYLRTAASAGIADAQVGIWSHSLPEHQQAVLANIKNPEDLTYLKTIEKERLWTVEKIEFLESAAAKGDYRAMVLLGDIYSTDRYVQPDLAAAHAYYEAAAESLNLPFIQSRISGLEAAERGGS